MALSSWFAKIGNLLLLRDRVRAARLQVSTRGEGHVDAANQARLLMEVARRVAEPVEALPPGAAPAVQVGLYADAAYWGLLALGATASTTPGSDPGELWRSAPADTLIKAAGDPQSLAAVEKTLGSRPLGGDLSATEADAIRARKFVEALVWELDAPERSIEHLLVQRWLRIGLATVVLLVAAVGIRSLVIGPNLIADRPFTTSSIYEPCAHKGMCSELMFHTLPQENPWVEFDLGSVKPVHRVEITNRSDCCAERIVGLLVELSTDNATWTQVARNDSVFSKWTPTFAKRRARYVRLRIPHNTSLHLDDVAIR
jgi:hypothetical protein